MQLGTKTVAEGMVIVENAGKAFQEIAQIAATTSSDVMTITNLMERHKEGQQKAAKIVDR